MESTDRASDAVARSRDVNIRGVLLFGFWLAVGIIAAQLAMWGLFRLLDKRQEVRERPLPPMVQANLQRTPPEPRLEPNPLVPRLRARAEEDSVLTTYGWVDPKSGVVRVPIDRAMDLLVERGLPPSKPMAPAPVAPAQTSTSPGVMQ